MHTHMHTHVMNTLMNGQMDRQTDVQIYIYIQTHRETYRCSSTTTHKEGNIDSFSVRSVSFVLAVRASLSAYDLCGGCTHRRLDFENNVRVGV